MDLRPYLVIPKFIQQPTWGGTYIRTLKGWEHLPFLKDSKIGQSYELYGNSKLAVSITDSADPRFIPEVGYPDKPQVMEEYFPLKEKDDWIPLSASMPLLIKINQASGNSFQLHVPTGRASDHWKPKPESWYFLEPGSITFGVRNGTDIAAYRAACEKIDAAMRAFSESVKTGALPLEEARSQAAALIAEINPWQFVNRLNTEKYDVVDLSGGGIHHSWEEDPQRTLGNVVYEVQHDVMDPVSTIRSFDQGKIKDDGSVRGLTIADYFQYLNTDPGANDIANARQKSDGEHVLRTPYYRMDEITLTQPREFSGADSFVHVFVRDGRAAVEANGVTVRISAGHSCFIPEGTGAYTITPEKSSVILKTYL